MAVLYVDLENGNDSNNGLTFATRKKTIDSASSAASSFDEIRVMGNETPVLLGNATWTSDQKEGEYTISSVDVSNTYARITVSSAQNHWNVGDWIQIRGHNNYINASGASLINGLWRISAKISSTVFELELCDTSGATVSGSSKGTVQFTSGSLVVLDGQKVQPIDFTWTATPVSNAPQDYVKTDTSGFTGIINYSYHMAYSYDTSTGGAYDTTTQSLLKTKPKTSWRLTTRYLNGLYNVLVEEMPYVGGVVRDPSVYTMTQVLNNTTGGQDNNSYTISPGFNVQYASSTYASTYINTNSYWAFNGSTNTNVHNVGTPYLRRITLDAKDNCARKIFRLTEGTTPNRVAYIYFEGLVGAPNASKPSDLIWEIVYNESTGTNKSIIDIHFHENANWSLITLEPSVVGGESKFGGTGYLIYISGTPANTNAVVGDCGSFDCSAYSKFAFNLRRSSSSAAIPSGVEIRITYGSGSYYSIPVPTDLSTDWLGLSYAPGGPLPSDVTGIEIYNGGSDITSLVAIELGDFSVLDSGLDFDSLIGQNTSGETWYKISGVSSKYGKTIFSLAPRFSETDWQQYGLTYLNGDNVYLNEQSSVTVPTYMLKPIVTTQQTLNKDKLSISGGWDRASMSTQSGETWYSVNFGSNHNFTAVTKSSCNLSNFGFLDSNIANLNIVTSCNDWTFTNIHSNYGKLDGFYSTNFTHSAFNNCHFVGNKQHGMRLDNSNTILIKNTNILCNGNGLYKGTTACATIDTINLKIRGSVTYSYYAYATHLSNDFNLDVSAGYGQSPMYYYNSYSNNIYGLRLNKARTSSATQWYFFNGDGVFTTQMLPTLSANAQMSGSTDGRQRLYWSNKSNPSGSISDYEFLKTSSSMYIQTRDNETLWDGTVGSCYRFYVFGAGTPWKSLQESYAFDLFECAVAANSQVTVTLYAKTASGLGHQMAMRLDTSTTDIGIDDDIITQIVDGSSASTSWTAYTLTFTPTKSGVARIKLNYWTTIQSSGFQFFFGGITTT